MLKMLEDHSRDLGEACVFMAMASFMKLEALKSLNEEHWSTVASDRLLHTLSKWARITRSTYTVFEVVCADGHEMLHSHGTFWNRDEAHRTGGHWNLLLIPSDVGYHVVPLAKPNKDAVLRLLAEPQEAREDPAGAEVAHEDLVEVQADAVEGDEGESPDPSAGEWEAEVSAAQALALMAELESDGQTLVEMVVEEPPLWEDEGIMRLFRGPCDLIRRAGEFECPQVEGPFSLSSLFKPRYKTVFKYRGIWEPPAGFDWVGGGWPSTENSRCTKSSVTRAPALCSADLESVSQWKESVLYLPKPPVVQNCWVVGNCSLTDGVRTTQFFNSGDVVKIGNYHYRAQEEVFAGLEVLRLIRSTEVGCLRAVGHSVRASLRNAWSNTVSLLTLGAVTLPKVEAHVETRPSQGAVSRDVLSRMEWALMSSLAPPECSAMVNVARNYAAMKEFGEEAPSAFKVAQVASALNGACRKVPFGFAGGRPYRWGYCYSCGKALPGKMAGRLCGCSQTPMARTVAAGNHVTSHGKPVYPGVVATQSRHPPLPPGKETQATSQCFRDAP
jgi:hypothetical protein